MAGQQLRRSQFILTYGPGSILEGPNGPRIVLALDQQGYLFKDLKQIKVDPDWQIGDQRLAHLLEGDIFEIPSNADLEKKDEAVVYQTARFPHWSLCPEHGILYHWKEGNTTACPRCPRFGYVKAARTRANSQAIRFIVACENGHMSNVAWSRMVHGHSDCDPEFFHWSGGGGSLEEVTITCSRCPAAKVSLLDIYRKTSFCTGRFPERGFGSNRDENTQNCDKEARVVQRGASGLYLPEVVTALTIPPLCSKLHDLLNHPDIRKAQESFEDLIDPVEAGNLQDFIAYLHKQADRNNISDSLVEQLASYDSAKILQAMKEVANRSALPGSMAELICQEFDALRTAARKGAPPDISPSDAKNRFEVNISEVRKITYGGLPFRITPVRRLRVVMALKGYRRINSLTGELADVFLKDCRGDIWFPGTEMFGEGIYIDFQPDQSAALQGSAFSQWQSLFTDQQSDIPPTELYSEPRLRRHPQFVFWHSLSHRLIRAFSVDSGYSSSAIRERVYLDEVNGQVAGGILLYTSQPGSDGTLGGLMVLTQRMESILEIALQDLDICSNDPLCSDQQPGPRQHSGASCYACCMISETSCEHRNMFLDRNLLDGCLHD
ncbi:MAG: hypothetical protein CVV27_03885 [Candidatus Melainabacteria bacterium HGW-Melainabacteria-1]|nr:MAG: hypothetical protein CVV27_03885 [Candidatus Melainabacteria bacterium HGW-Melainabacteria-1]